MTTPTYIFAVVANGSNWCYFDAAVIPGHEDDLRAAILADIADSQAYEIENALRLYGECKEEGESFEDYKARVTSELTYDFDTYEAYTIDEDGSLGCAASRATYHSDSPENIAKALPLNGKPFAFKVGRSGAHG